MQAEEVAAFRQRLESTLSGFVKPDAYRVGVFEADGLRFPVVNHGGIHQLPGIVLAEVLGYTVGLARSHCQQNGCGRPMSDFYRSRPVRPSLTRTCGRGGSSSAQCHPASSSPCSLVAPQTVSRTTPSASSSHLPTTPTERRPHRADSSESRRGAVEVTGTLGCRSPVQVGVGTPKPTEGAVCTPATTDCTLSWTAGL